MLVPQVKREAIRSIVNKHHLSERHACALVGLSRNTYRHVGQISALNVELHEQIIQTAYVRRRWGYRMIHDVLRPKYPNINHKRVYRIYTAEGLSIRKRKKTKRIDVRVPPVAAMAVNQPGRMRIGVSLENSLSNGYTTSLCGRTCQKLADILLQFRAVNQAFNLWSRLFDALNLHSVYDSTQKYLEFWTGGAVLFDFRSYSRAMVCVKSIAMALVLNRRLSL